MNILKKSLLVSAVMLSLLLVFTSCATKSNDSAQKDKTTTELDLIKGEQNMTNVLTIIARVEAKKDRIDFVKSEALKLIEPTRSEEGCIRYNLHQDNEKPEIFIFVENWKSQELFQLHLESSHLKAFVEATDGSLVDLTINNMSKIDQAL